MQLPSFTFQTLRVLSIDPDTIRSEFGETEQLQTYKMLTMYRCDWCISITGIYFIKHSLSRDIPFTHQTTESNLVATKLLSVVWCVKVSRQKK